MAVTALDAKSAGDPFGLTNYDKLKDDIDWLIAGEVVYAVHGSDVSTTGTSFGAGADALASALSFDADGTSDYLVEIACACIQAASGDTAVLQVSLDGVVGATLSEVVSSAGSISAPLSGRAVIAAPSAGTHTVNGRLWVTGGTGTLSSPIVMRVGRIN